MSFQKKHVTFVLTGTFSLLLTFLIIAGLYFGKEFLVPLALSILITFLLAPLVAYVSKWIGKITAVIVIVSCFFGLLGFTSYLLTKELVDLATQLPNYKTNIQSKIQTLMPREDHLTRMLDTVEEIQKGISKEIVKPSVGPKKIAKKIQLTKEVESKKIGIESIHWFLAAVFNLIGSFGLVLFLVIFMLFNRKDLRSRIIRLIGKEYLLKTTQAMDDASHRVSRYLVMQLIINVIFGSLISIGLFFIGVPNALLWGGLSALLKFIPYVGVWIAALMPLVLAFAVSVNWTMPLLTLGLFILCELLSFNVLEPILYSVSTGVSSTALILAAVFWTWIWGPVGLVLSTPLTVCLNVLGRYVPGLSFLNILLGKEEALTFNEEFYQRMLLNDLNEVIKLADKYLENHSIEELYDHVFIPLIINMETDYQETDVDIEKKQIFLENMKEIIEDFSNAKIMPAITANKTHKNSHVCCLAAQAERDELANIMLVDLLKMQSIHAEILSYQLTIETYIELLHKKKPKIIVISVMYPSTILHARHLSLRLKQELKNVKIILGLWGSQELSQEYIDRLSASGIDEAVISFSQAINKISNFSERFFTNPLKRIGASFGRRISRKKVEKR